MQKRLILCAAIVLGGISAATVSTAPADAHSIGRTNLPHCKNPVEGRVGLAVGKDKAKERARRKWSYDVKRTYGYRFTDWGQARNKDYHCKKKAGTWRCRAHANPCDAQAH